MKKQLLITIFLEIIKVNLVKSETDYFKLEKNKLPCSYFETVNITDGVKNNDDSITYKGITYPRQNYAVYEHHYPSRTMKIDAPKQIRGCVCDFTTCIRMCCPDGYIYYAHSKTDKCQPHENYQAFHVNITHPNETVTGHDITKHQTFSGIVGKPCDGFFLEPEVYDEEEWVVVSDGRLHLNYNSSHKYIDRNSYCLASVFSNKNETEPTLRAIKCAREKDTIAAEYSIGMLISVPFLLATLGVYAWIGELRATLPGKSLMCYVAALTISYIFLSAAQINGDGNIPYWLRLIIAYTIHTSFILSFFWVNVISFDIWWTFGKGGDHDGRRFLKYSAYACGCTALVIFIAALLDNTKIVSENFRPGFGLKSCWLQDIKMAQFLYLYLPLIIIITANIIFFALTANEIRLTKKNLCKTWSNGVSRKHSKTQSDKDEFGLYLRLFIIMGVTWSMEAISWVVGDSSWIFYIADVFNCLQGVLIFLLFVWKQRVKSLIRQKYRAMRGLDSESSSSRTSTSNISKERLTLQARNESYANNNNINTISVNPISNESV